MTQVKLTIGEKYLPLLELRPHNALFSGRGAGKSVAITQILSAIAHTDCKRVVCGRQYQSSIAESSKAQLEQSIFDLGLNESYKITKTSIVHKTTGSNFTFTGLDINPDSFKSQVPPDIFFGEEAASIKKSVFIKVIPTFLRKPKSSVIFSWNPEFPTDAVDEYYRGPNPPENSFIQRFTQKDNPYFQQTELYAQYLHDQKYSSNFNHVWGGDYNNNSDARIFNKVFTGHKNTIGLNAVYGIDFGFSKDPNAIVKAYINHAERWIYIPEAIYFNCALIDMPDYITSISGASDSLIVGDSSRPETIDFLNTAGFSVVGALKGAGSVKTGISFIQGYDIFIPEELEDLHIEMQRYQWMTDKNGRVLNIPVDKYNHLIDALRYALERDMYAYESDNDNSKGIARIRRLNRG